MTEENLVYLSIANNTGTTARARLYMALEVGERLGRYIKYGNQAAWLTVTPCSKDDPKAKKLTYVKDKKKYLGQVGEDVRVDWPLFGATMTTGFFTSAGVLHVNRPDKFNVARHNTKSKSATVHGVCISKGMAGRLVVTMDHKLYAALGKPKRMDVRAVESQPWLLTLVVCEIGGNEVQKLGGGRGGKYLFNVPTAWVRRLQHIGTFSIVEVRCAVNDGELNIGYPALQNVQEGRSPPVTTPVLSDTRRAVDPHEAMTSWVKSLKEAMEFINNGVRNGLFSIAVLGDGTIGVEANF